MGAGDGHPQVPAPVSVHPQLFANDGGGGGEGGVESQRRSHQQPKEQQGFGD